MKIQGTVYLMRHGRTVLDAEHRSDGWLDMSLSPDGEVSVIPAQQCLKAIPLKAIYAPTLKRTVQTAEIMASGNVADPPVKTNDRAKTWNLGVIAGTQKRYGRPEVQKLIATPTKAPLGGESYNAFTKRFVPWFKNRLAEASGAANPLLIICSGSNLRCIGKTLFDDEDCVDMEEGGLAILRKIRGEWHHEIICGDPEAKSGLDAVNMALAKLIS